MTNCFWCGSRKFDDTCQNCLTYAAALKNSPSRINGFDGRKKKPHGNQYSRKVYKDTPASLENLMKGVRYE